VVHVAVRAELMLGHAGVSVLSSGASALGRRMGLVVNHSPSLCHLMSISVMTLFRASRKLILLWLSFLPLWLNSEILEWLCMYWSGDRMVPVDPGM
jgi:hypothetical protein